jgi:hypothetical protein
MHGIKHRVNSLHHDFFFKDTSWTAVSVLRRNAKRPKYNAVDTDVEDATPRCLF